MRRRSPPKYRHDGASPLPMGMDWSPPPRKWNGRVTVWPHDPRTGWSYCVTLPSWVILPKSKDSEPVVFYRVQIGVQSPEGITIARTVLRRFNDFLKLFADLRKAFPRKNLPPAPPKGLLRLKSRVLLEERRCALEEWMTKLLSDIDLSRSFIVASFLELEAAVRSSFQDADQNTLEANSDKSSTSSSVHMAPDLTLLLAGGSSSITSDYGSDTAYETSELGTPRLGKDDHFDAGLDDLTLDENLTNPIENLVKFGMSNIDEGLFMGQTILEHLEGFPKHKARSRHDNHTGKDTYNGNSSKSLFFASNGSGLFSETEPRNVIGHIHKLSSESNGSSLRDSEVSNSVIPNSASNSYQDLHGASEVSSTVGSAGNTEIQGDAQIVLPLDQRNKLNRILLTMQQRLVTSKTDMEDLIARLNQEVAVKDYLTTKVKDLEVELETTKQKNKENLQQAITVERERFTQMQWDMEELRRKSLEMELKLRSEQGMNSHMESTKSDVSEKDELLKDYDATKQQLDNLSRRYEELEAKSKGDIKILVKEVKSLRKSQLELKQELCRSEMEKSEAENLLQRERQMVEIAAAARKKVVNEGRILHDRLKSCSHNLTDDEGNLTTDSASLAGALHLLSTSDEEIRLILGEAQKLSTRTDETTDKDIDELRNTVADIITANAKLGRLINAIIRRALKLDVTSTNDDPER